MMKKKLALLALLTLLPLLCACSQQPPEGLKENTPEGAVTIDALPDASADLQWMSTLYFLYGDTGLLRQETRQIAQPPNEPRELALVQALLDGPREGGGRALFPDKTQVLSTQGQDGVVYVTFNESLYDRYSDEDPVQENALLRRRLALDALTATLTESGEYRAVQVLVRPEETVGRSMRLTTRFLRQEPESTLPLLTRQSDRLPTPAAYARELLTAWQSRQSDLLGAYVSGRDGQMRMEEALSAAPVLLSFAVYDGTVSPDGQSAVVCADLVLRDQDGAETVVDACPVPLVREGGAWKITRSQLIMIMGESNE